MIMSDSYIQNELGCRIDSPFDDYKFAYEKGCERERQNELLIQKLKGFLNHVETLEHGICLS